MCRHLSEACVESNAPSTRAWFSRISPSPLRAFPLVVISFCFAVGSDGLPCTLMDHGLDQGNTRDIAASRIELHCVFHHVLRKILLKPLLTACPFSPKVAKWWICCSTCAQTMWTSPWAASFTRVCRMSAGAMRTTAVLPEYLRTCKCRSTRKYIFPGKSRPWFT